MDGKKSSPKEAGGDSSEAFSDAPESCTDGIRLAIEEYRKLPPAVKRRVRALKKLQYETVKIDAAFYKELFELEAKYDVLHQEIFKTREKIVSGEKEPNDEECDWPEDEDEVDSLVDKVKENVVVSTVNEQVVEVGESKGIPEFWLKTMRYVSLLDDMIKPHDVDILKHLVDMKCVLNVGDEPGFTLEFYFSPNSYFTNPVLTKRYYFDYEINSDELFDYAGPQIVRAKGCAINWNPGKNVTVKLIKKVQKKKIGNAKRVVTKTVQEDSFFNLFEPPSQSISGELDEDIEMLLEADFKIGQFIRESLIPKAVLYFTGEVWDSEAEDDDEEDEDEEDEDEESGDEDEDENETPRHPPRGRHHHRHAANQKHSKDPNAPTDPVECRSQ